MSRPDNPIEYGPNGELYLGSKIRDLRQGKGWSLEDIAKRISRHPASLSKVENNDAKPSNQTLVSLASLLEIPLAELKQAPLHPRLTVRESKLSAQVSPPPESLPRQGVEAEQGEMGGPKAAFGGGVGWNNIPRRFGFSKKGGSPDRESFGYLVEQEVTKASLTVARRRRVEEMILEIARTICRQMREEQED